LNDENAAPSDKWKFYIDNKKAKRQDLLSLETIFVSPIHLKLSSTSSTQTLLIQAHFLSTQSLVLN
jgi:hypothetical protein